MKIGRIFKGFRKGQKGFTLVELLIVVAILGILAAVAIPNLVSFIGTGDTEAKATEFDVVQTATIALLADAGVAQLDDGYTNVNTQAEVALVLATDTTPDPDVVHNLSQYLFMPGDFLQAYDIAQSGIVSVVP